MIEAKLTEMLGQLSEKLGIASAKIWEWSLLQVKVDIVTDIILLVLAVVATAGVVKYFAWAHKNWEDINSDQEVVHFSAIAILALAVFILDIASIFALFALPKLLINPEYAAFRNIVEQLGSLK